MSNTTCAVCLEGFNKTTRARTNCPYCSTSVCRTCIQTYIVNDINDVPRCINPDCGHGWEREFLDKECTRTFRLSTYKEHREKVLSDREKARLPITQEDAIAYKGAKDIYLKASEECVAISAQLIALKRELDAAVIRRYLSRRTVDSYGRLRMPATDGEPVARDPRPAAAQRVPPTTFIKPCPAENCKGFLSSAWKCGLCALWSCPECHEVKGSEREAEHTCDPGKRASAQLIERESRGCPKCGTRICKIEGCDQMWCTMCNTGFNWRTGKLADGPVHNPHYFAWLRSQGRDPANAGAGGGAPAPVDCDRDMDRQISRLLTGGPLVRRIHTEGGSRRWDMTSTNEYIAEVWRIMREQQDPYNNRAEGDLDEQFRIMRVRYMADELSEEEWKVALQRCEKDVHFRRAKRQVREVFVGASRDIIRQILTPEHNVEEIRRQLKELIQYCNESYTEIAKRFGRKIDAIRIGNDYAVA